MINTQLNFFEEEIIQIKEKPPTILKQEDYVDLKDVCQEFNLLTPMLSYRLYKTGSTHFWGEIDNTGLFEGNDFPFLQNMDTGKIIQMNLPMTYPMFPYFSVKKTVHNVYAHRLIAMAFIQNPNPDHNKVVNHINYNSCDYRASNLEWTTMKENCVGPKKEASKSLEEKYDNIIEGILKKMGRI